MSRTSPCYAFIGCMHCVSFKGTDVTPWLGSKVVCLARAPQRMLARIIICYLLLFIIMYYNYYILFITVPVGCWTTSCCCSLHLNLVKGEVHIEAAQF